MPPAPTTPEPPRDAAAWHSVGLAQHNLANYADAVRSLGKAAALDRGRARYHHDLANALVEDGKPDRAITAYRRALRIDDTLAEAHNDLGTAYFDKGWYLEAEACFRRAIALQPDHGIAHANLGAALRALGQLGEGRRQFQRALLLKIRAALPSFLRWPLASPAAPAAPTEAAAAGLQKELSGISIALLAGKVDEAHARSEKALRDHPRDPDVLYLASTIAEERNAAADALALIDSAIEIKPERAEYHVARARMLIAADRAEAALQAVERALVLDPGSAEAHAMLAAVYRAGHRLDLAVQAGSKALELDPESHSAHSNLSSAYWGEGNLEAAQKHAREALRLGPRSIHYHLNLAVILKDAGSILESRRMYREALERIPPHPGLMLNMGTLALQCEGDLAAARGWYRRALAIGPDPKVTLSESIIDLLDGDYAAAWPKYEARKQVTGHQERHAPLAALPVWEGETMGTGRLLIYGEQGLGDEVMFASMFAKAHARAPQVMLACDSRLAALFARSFPAFEVIAVPTNTAPQLSTAPERAIAMGSLPLHFRRAAADFPAHHGYLATDPAQVARWRERLHSAGAGKRIGVSWAGGTPATGQARRSLQLAQLRPLFEMPGTSWVSLQYGKAAEEAAAFARESGMPLQVFPGIGTDIDELASLIDALDLVVSVCSTTVHVAGALGKEVLVMAPFLPEWRYGMRGERMAWYPSARVFRQKSFEDWDSVIAQVKARLQL